MGQNTGRPGISPERLQRIITDAVGTLVSRHHDLGEEFVVTVVHDAAFELVSALSDLTELPLLLHRRANARLLAVAGQPVAIRMTTPATTN